MGTNEGHRERLKEKYSAGGFDSFYHSYEKLEFLLSFTIPRKDVKDLAKELLEKFGSIDNVLKATEDELIKFTNLGKHSAIFLNFIGDLHKDIFKERLKIDKLVMTSKNQVISYLRNEIGHSERENFIVLYLDSSNQLIDEKYLKSDILFKGTLDRSAVYPREVVGKLLKQHLEIDKLIESKRNKKSMNQVLLEEIISKKAKSVIFAHNHPSGSTKPSRSDIELTKKMQEILEGIDVRLLDHIIITKESYFSFLEEGILEN